jgi:hypothetical protein
VNYNIVRVVQNPRLLGRNALTLGEVLSRVHRSGTPRCSVARVWLVVIG